MSKPKKYNSNFFKPPQQLFGVKGLASAVEYDVLVYILKFVYRLVLESDQRKESGSRLKRRIQRFEKDSLIPGFLSALPLDQLIEQLEDAQYYYPIYSRDITLPRFI